MENDVVKEIVKKLKWHEKIIVKLFKKIFLKVYNNTRVSIINAIEQK